MEAEKHSSEKQRDHERNQKGNQSMHRNKWKWKDNNPKPVGHCKTVLRGKFIAIQAYLKKQVKEIPYSTPEATRKGRNEGLVEGNKS